MNVGDRFEDIDAQGVVHDCVVVWTGTQYLCAHRPWPMGSSMVHGESQQPAKSLRSGGRSTPVQASQARLFA